MENSKALNHTIAAIGEAALLIWWGMVIVIDPLTIGMGAMGTGIIFLGVNAARLLCGIPAKRSTTLWGVIALAWGALAHGLHLGLWPSVAAMMIMIGVVEVFTLLVFPRTEKAA